jgi:Leucine-rich repeat (LRR) protein
LHLSGISGDRPGLSLTSELFESTRRLEQLSIVDSQLTSIADATFCPLTDHLQLLNLSHNNLNNASQLGWTGCSAHSLVMIDLSSNTIQSIRSTDVNAFVSVRSLSLADNQLESIATLDRLTHLQQLDLQHNHLHDIRQLPARLVHLNLADNRLSIIPHAVAEQMHLVSLNLSHNRIDGNSPFLLANQHLESIDLSHNNFGYMPSALLHNCTALITLRLDANRIESLPDSAFHRHPNLQVLSIRSNRIVQLTASTFAGLGHLDRLDLSTNAISMIDSEAFAPLVQLTQLNLADNLLLEVPFALGKLYNLVRLTIGANQITRAHKFLFNKLPTLRRLDMSGNKLATVCYCSNI